jgi:uncharacterized membrane protein YfcA
MSDLLYLLPAGAAVVTGAALQSGVGLGLGLVVAPAMAFLQPSLMPGAGIAINLVLAVMTAVGEWRHVDWRGVAWATPARLPGSLAGAWLVTVIPAQGVSAAVGVMVLVAVAATYWARRVRVPLRPWSLVAAGSLSGLTGTATSIGGPPVALLYQYEEPARVRATLAVVFASGSVISLGALGASGSLTAGQLGVAALLTPFVVAGYVVGRPLRNRLGAARLRSALLLVVTASGASLLLRAMA